MTRDEFFGAGQVILNRYELERVLGSGGWGRVYLANDQLLHRLVAIKQLLPRLAADPAAVSRFKREASVIASIRDPNVLTIYDIAQSDDQHYMVMEYADAGTLAQMMQLEGILSSYEALSVAIDICKGLRAIHLKGVIHRDIKPANVMFFSRPDSPPVAKLGDFGIALQQEEQRLTPSDSVVGTLIYLSPEQASSYRVLTPASDLYSLGAIVYEMTNGELQEPVFLDPLFAGTSSEVLQRLNAVPEPVRPLLVKALQRKLENRFQSADEMLQALERSRSRLTTALSTQAFGQILVTPLAPEKPRRAVTLLAAATITLTLLVGGIVTALGWGAGLVSPSQALVTTPIPTSTPTPMPIPTLTPMPIPKPITPSPPTAAPTLMPTPTPTASPEPTPSPLPSPSPTPSPRPTSARPTQVRGPASLTLLFHESSNAPDGVYAARDDSSDPILYQEGSNLWGEISTRIGDAVFVINRNDVNREDPKQHLPPHLQLKVDYSAELLAAMEDLKTQPPGFDARTGEFWAGHFRCGSAVQAKDSPYWIAVQLLENGQAIASHRYVVGVLDNPACSTNINENPSGPPTRRP